MARSRRASSLSVEFAVQRRSTLRKDNALGKSELVVCEYRALPPGRTSSPWHLAAAERDGPGYAGTVNECRRSVKSVSIQESIEVQNPMTI